MNEKVEPNWLAGFEKDTTPTRKDFGYVPLPTNVEGEPEGSVYAAHLRQDNTIGSMLNAHSTYQLDEETRKNYDFTQYASQIPRDLIDYADKFYGATSEDDFKSIEGQIRQELADKSLLAAHPWKSIAYSLDPLEPMNWLPFGVLFKGIKTGSRVSRAMMGGALSTVGAVGAQEAILHQNQLTRTMQESLFNVAASGIVGGVLGGLGAGLHIRAKTNKIAATKAERQARSNIDVEDSIRGFNETKGSNVSNLDIEPEEDFASLTIELEGTNEYQARKAMHTEVRDVLTETDKPLSDNGTLTPDDLARMPVVVQKAMQITPMNRLLNSPFKIAKWFGSATYEHNYTLVKNTDGISGGISLERSMKLDFGGVANSMVKYQDIYFKMHGVDSGVFKGTRSKLSDVNMNKDQFDDAVSLVLTTEQPHPNPHVNDAARLLRDEVFDPFKNRAIELGLLPEDVTVPNAVNYFMTLYNKNKIVEQGGKSARGAGTFPQYLFDQFQTGNEITRQFKESPGYRLKRAIADDLHEKMKEAKRIKASIDPKDKAKLEAIKDHIADLKQKVSDAEESILFDAPPAALTWEGKLHDVLESDEVIWSHVEQTIDNVLGNTEGKLLNPFLQKLGGGKPLKARKLLVDQEAAREWHITNAVRVADAYTRAMVPVIRLTEFSQKLGFKNIEEMQVGLGNMLKKEYDLASAGVTGKPAQKLLKEYNANLSDMKATLELLQGVYGNGSNVLNNSAKDYYNNFLKWNYVRLLGYMTISSIADAGAMVFTHGIYRTMHDGLLKSFSGVKQISKRDLRAIGYGIETDLGTRIKSYTEHEGLSTDPSPFTKGLDTLTRNFGNLSLMNHWNSMMQNLAGHVSINRTLETIHKYVGGKPVPIKDLERLARLGIDKEHFDTLYKFTENNLDSSGAYFADWQNWNITNASEATALRQFQASVGKEIDNIVIVPGLGDKPLLAHQSWGNVPVGKLVLQFKSFLMASTNRVLYSGIQRRSDQNVYQGIVAMLSLGALSYIATSYLRGSEPDLSYKNLRREALDKSGLLGIWGEAFNIGQKALGFGEVSRYKSRDILGSLIGPSGGAVTEMFALMNKIRASTLGEDVLTTKDTEKILRLIPLQNLFYLNQLNRSVNKKVSTELGAVPVD